jgi:16S rRNA (cytosine967-C5)-methyltransferase
MQVKQLAIMNSAVRLLKPGGRIVYATCSLMPAENEVVAQQFSEAHPELIKVSALDILTQSGVENAATLVNDLGQLRLWPHRHSTDGFYAAVWEKKA